MPFITSQLILKLSNRHMSQLKRQSHHPSEVHVQVELAQSEYQLPRLTRMWTHLERQAGGRVRGMGEKQIEVDKRILRTRMGQLRRSLEDVRMHRKQYRERRAEVCLPSKCTPNG